MNKLTLLCVSSSTLLVAACSTSQRVAPTSCCQHDNDHAVALSSIPKAALSAATKSVAGFQPVSAKLKHKNSEEVYEIEGTSPKGKYEIDVTGTGRVLEIDRD